MHRPLHKARGPGKIYSGWSQKRDSITGEEMVTQVFGVSKPGKTPPLILSAGWRRRSCWRGVGPPHYGLPVVTDWFGEPARGLPESGNDGGERGFADDALEGGCWLCLSR